MASICSILSKFSSFVTFYLGSAVSNLCWIVRDVSRDSLRVRLFVVKSARKEQKYIFGPKAAHVNNNTVKSKKT